MDAVITHFDSLLAQALDFLYCGRSRLFVVTRSAADLLHVHGYASVIIARTNPSLRFLKVCYKINFNWKQVTF